jgi:hypothetical protein
VAVLQGAIPETAARDRQLAAPGGRDARAVRHRALADVAARARAQAVLIGAGATGPRRSVEPAQLLVKARASHAERRAIASGKKAVASTGTTDMSNAPKQVAPEPAVAPPPSSDRKAPELGPEQYAWVAATLRKTPPERINEALERLRLTPATRQALDELWQARMAKDPALSATVAAAVRRFLAMPGPGD